MTTPKAFDDLIKSEHAAIYAYGVIAAFADNQDLALDHLAIHRIKRDELIALATLASLAIPPAAVAYEMPIQVDSTTTAAACASTIEESLCAHWSNSARFLPQEIQSAAVSFTQTCAQRAFAWSGISKAFYS